MTHREHEPVVLAAFTLTFWNKYEFLLEFRLLLCSKALIRDVSKQKELQSSPEWPEVSASVLCTDQPGRNLIRAGSLCTCESHTHTHTQLQLVYLRFAEVGMVALTLHICKLETMVRSRLSVLLLLAVIVCVRVCDLVT